MREFTICQNFKIFKILSKFKYLLKRIKSKEKIATNYKRITKTNLAGTGEPMAGCFRKVIYMSISPLQPCNHVGDTPKMDETSCGLLLHSIFFFTEAPKKLPDSAQPNKP
jgi:hypothetical protein